MSKDWINAYSDNKTRKFQAGGAMGAEAGMAPAQGPDLEGMLMEYAQTRDPQLAVAICDMLVEMMAGAEAAPVEGTPAPEEAAAPPMAKFGRKMAKAPVF